MELFHSPFQLVVNEGHGSIEILHERNHSKYAELIPMPIREHNDFYTLEDIIAADKNAIDKEVNLLFLIREAFITILLLLLLLSLIELNCLKLFLISKTGQPEEFMGKNGKPCHKLDTIIFDDTNSNFKLTMSVEFKSCIGFSIENIHFCFIDRWDKELIKYALTWSPRVHGTFRNCV